MKFFRTVLPFAKNSLANGLQLLIDIEAFDYAHTPTGAEGAVVGITHHLDIPIMKNTGNNIHPGTDMQVKSIFKPTLFNIF